MPLNLHDFDKKIDRETGAVLFVRRGFQGPTDRTIDLDGLTVEFHGEEIVIIDVFDIEAALTRLMSMESEIHRELLRA